ncbi:MAG: MerR family transcriptional regulator [Planctomycetota bacterium]|jgi:MerR family mercuric resistance operon transcriptional regulator
MAVLTIGQLARQAGVGVETIRFYERSGLIAEPPRGNSGYRHYSPDAVLRIRFIRHAKELGFSLKEIAELLDLRVHPRTNCAVVRRSAEMKIAEIETKISSLRRMRKSLQNLTRACEKRQPTSECPVLETLGRID